MPPRRPPRRHDGPPSGGRGRSGRSGRPGSRPGGRASGRSGRRETDATRPRRPPTAAERRAAEVRERRGERKPFDPDAERAKIEARSTEQWVEVSDDESVGSEPAGRVADAPPGGRKLGAPVDPVVAAELRATASDRRVGDRHVARFGQATDALERNRLDEARRLIKPLVDHAPGVAAVQQLAGLIHYRLGRWRVTVGHLEAARTLITDGSDLDFVPVLADAYRALRRWKEVDRLWSEVREASPAPAILNETRIVAAGAAADRDDLNGAIATMGKVSPRPKRVREYHVRQWYVLGDLHDRAGNTIEARRWFERVVAHDRAFADAADRLRALGR